MTVAGCYAKIALGYGRFGLSEVAGSDTLSAALVSVSFLGADRVGFVKGLIQREGCFSAVGNVKKGLASWLLRDIKKISIGETKKCSARHLGKS